MGWTSGGVVKETRKWVCHIKNSQERVKLYSLRGFLFELQNPSKCLRRNRFVARRQIRTRQSHTCTHICNLMSTKTTQTAINLFFKTSRPSWESSMNLHSYNHFFLKRYEDNYLEDVQCRGRCLNCPLVWSFLFVFLWYSQSQVNWDKTLRWSMSGWWLTGHSRK